MMNVWARLTHRLLRLALRLDNGRTAVMYGVTLRDNTVHLPVGAALVKGFTFDVSDTATEGIRA